MPLRDLPASVPTLLGPVPVLVVDVVHDDGRRGEWHSMRRVIRVHSGYCDVAQWQTLGHEITHAILDDTAAQHVLTERQTEIVCDAVGTWIAAAIASGTLTVRLTP